MNKKQKTPRNKTITLCNEEIDFYSKKLITLNKKCKTADILNKTINQDFFEVVNFLPDNFVDLLIIDPPYNLNKSFNKLKFSKIPVAEYSDWIDKIIQKLIPTLKPTATIYFCGEWNSSASIFPVLDKHFKVRNRITWEREKGRGAKSNWKNNSEDIWYGTYTDDFVFNIEDVKLKRKVLAPYRDENGTPKDWNENKEGGFRLTFPSQFKDMKIMFFGRGIHSRKEGKLNLNQAKLCKMALLLILKIRIITNLDFNLPFR
jgi:site-specific DNA-methyltransferase (adenine-specific)